MVFVVHVLAALLWEMWTSRRQSLSLVILHQGMGYFHVDWTLWIITITMGSNPNRLSLSFVDPPCRCHHWYCNWCVPLGLDLTSGDSLPLIFDYKLQTCRLVLTATLSMREVGKSISWTVHQSTASEENWSAQTRPHPCRPIWVTQTLPSLTYANGSIVCIMYIKEQLIETRTYPSHTHAVLCCSSNWFHKYIDR
jgi:hypothetical protein